VGFVLLDSTDKLHGVVSQPLPKPLFECIPQNKRKKQAPWNAKDKQIGNVIVRWITMTRAANKPTKVFLKGFADKKNLPLLA
jgi:hypothetical protein